MRFFDLRSDKVGGAVTLHSRFGPKKGGKEEGKRGKKEGISNMGSRGATEKEKKATPKAQKLKLYDQFNSDGTQSGQKITG